MKKQLHTSIIINAPIQKVWDILTSFHLYPSWNSFITHIEGIPTINQTIKVKIQGMSFTPKILKFASNEEFRWRGKLLFPGLFDGEHSFKLTENKDGSVLFEQSEFFSGVLVGLFSKKLDTETLNGFNTMNKELKTQAEKEFVTS